MCIGVYLHEFCLSAPASAMKEPWSHKVERIRMSSPYGSMPNWSIPTHYCLSLLFVYLFVCLLSLTEVPRTDLVDREVGG